jgi:acetoin utilization deacetylase AcuC-like enzyme
MEDPLGGMRLSSSCFGRLTSMIVAVAEECCEGRVVGVTEGGYSLQGLAEGLRETIDALDAAPVGDSANQKVTPAVTGGGAPNTSRGEATLQAVLPALSPYWQL